MINHKPCVTDEEIFMRICEDQKELDDMSKEGYAIKSRLSWHSPSSLETHCLPVFFSDTLQDVVNRYYDFFPVEFKQMTDIVAEFNKALYSSDAMSKEKTMMSAFKVPLGLYKLLEEWREGFWEVDNVKKEFVNKKLINQFLSYAPKLKVQSPNGKRTVTV